MAGFVMDKTMLGRLEEMVPWVVKGYEHRLHDCGCPSYRHTASLSRVGCDLNLKFAVDGWIFDVDVIADRRDVVLTDDWGRALPDPDVVYVVESVVSVSQRADPDRPVPPPPRPRGAVDLVSWLHSEPGVVEFNSWRLSDYHEYELTTGPSHRHWTNKKERLVVPLEHWGSPYLVIYSVFHALHLRAFDSFEDAADFCEDGVRWNEHAGWMIIQRTEDPVPLVDWSNQVEPKRSKRDEVVDDG